MPIRKLQHIPFAQRKRSAQKRAYWEVLKNICRAAPIVGGKFYSRHYMHGQTGWIDGYFLGSSKPVYYNFCIQTTRYAYKEKVVDLAWEKSYEIAPVDADPSIFDRTVKDPTSGLYFTPAHEPYSYPELDGMTRLDWTQAQLPEIANSLEVTVFEQWTLHHDYHSGIGLHATIDVPYLTIESVNVFIDRFMQTQSAYMSREELAFRHEQIAHWGIEPNAIAHPWEWGPVPQEQDDSLGEVDPTVQRASEAIEKAVRLGNGIPAETVIAKLEARLEAARALKGSAD
jgi:hypothetical protein